MEVKDDWAWYNFCPVMKDQEVIAINAININKIMIMQ